VTQLCLAGPELAECLCYRHALNASLEKCVELCGACRDAPNLLTTLHDLHPCLEALALDFLSDLVALLRLGLCDTLNVQHVFLRAHKDGHDSGEARLLELLDIGHIDSVLLQLVYLVEGLLFLFVLPHVGRFLLLIELRLRDFFFLRLLHSCR